MIGSVLVARDERLRPHEDQRLRDSVSQAAPVLANLRNLAIAELRASTDALTGLPNARSVQATLKRMVAQASRSGLPLAALLVDLDHFKQVNDSYGHGRGDEVLAAAAEAMRSAVRESDFVGRYGGEEFLLLLPDTDSEGALRSAEAVRAAVGAVSVPSVDRQVTTSVGVAVLGEDGIDGDTLDALRRPRALRREVARPQPRRIRGRGAALDAHRSDRLGRRLASPVNERPSRSRSWCPCRR